MGHLISSEAELCQARDVIGSFLFDVMLEAGAVPNLSVVHPLLLTHHGSQPGAGVQEQLQQLQTDVAHRAPSYLRDLISRLSAFSDEPRVVGLVGALVVMVVDLVCASSTSSQSPGSALQRSHELQDLMEEYLKRVRISLNDKTKLEQDTSRLESHLSLKLTQLKSCLLQDCDSRCLRLWASGAALHVQMLVHLAGLEDQVAPLGARAALRQYREDLQQIKAAYRKYKSCSVRVVKCRGGLTASRELSGEDSEEGAMTGLMLMDRESGVSVTVPLRDLEALTGDGLKTGRDYKASGINLELITSDQYAQAYLHHFFSERGPVAKVETYFIKASANLDTLPTNAQHNDDDKGSGHDRSLSTD